MTALRGDDVIWCPFCDGTGEGPSIDGVCNGCAGSCRTTVDGYKLTVAHRDEMIRRRARVSIAAPVLPLKKLVRP